MSREVFNVVLVHVARTWERVRLTMPHQEMPQDNIESADDAIPTIAEQIFNNDIIQGFLNSEDQDDYFDRVVGEFSDVYIEGEAERLIKEYL